MSVSLTDSAVNRVQNYLTQRGHGVGLRLGVRKSGCNGYAYVIEYADAVAEDDTVFEQDGLKVLVDEASLPFIDGTEVDFVQDGLNQVFRFNNPNVAGECGCGESFNVAD
ncbi:MAG: iron-sulfur cluster assembly accessory protein [Pseudomonadota bacterium]